MVSPSGIGSCGGQQRTAEVETERRKMETGFLQEGGKEVMRRRLTIDRGDEHAPR